jgi:MFS family permease
LQDLAETEPQRERGTATGFSSYLFVHGAWFLTNGLQGVLFPYLVRITLAGTEAELGIAQMCLNLPSTLLVLVGGIIADRVDVKRQIRRLYAISTLPYLALGVLLVAKSFSYPILIAYALVIGAISAFTLPTRDALLARVAPDPAAGGIQRAVSLASLAQFSGQIIGMTLASGSAFFGVIPLFFLQATVIGAGAIIVQRLNPRPAPPRRARGSGNVLAFTLGELWAGFRAVMASPVIGPLTLISFGVAASLVGSMQVLMPLLVQAYFPADLAPQEQPRVASAFAIFTLCFWIGTILTAFLLVKIGMPRRKGRLYLGAVMLGGALLLIESLPISFPVFCFLNLLWGVINGFIITIGRGIVQELAEEQLRARILSVFSFGFMVGGPLGALSLGFLAGAIGPHAAILVPGAAAILIALAGALSTGLWNMVLDVRTVTGRA